MNMDITQSTMIELRDAIAAKQVTAHEVTEAYLQRIAALNDSLGAYTQVFAERALQRADEVDAGKVTGALAGVPITYAQIHHVITGDLPRASRATSAWRCTRGVRNARGGGTSAADGAFDAAAAAY